MKRIRTRLSAVAMALVMAVSTVGAYAAGEDRTYTVSANIFCPGELNTQLPGVTAYMTNGSNPLGQDGYPATAPTTPVSDNATLTVASDGTLTLTVPVPNPVFTLQSIGGCSNATVVDKVKDSRDYNNMDGTPGRKGRITKVTFELEDSSGTYVFTSCKEYPTLLSCEWTVPLTLAVDFTGVDLSVPDPAPAETPVPSDTSVPAVTPEPTPAPSSVPTPVLPTPAPAAVNTDALKALMATVDQMISEAVISADGSDVEPSRTWVRQQDVDDLRAARGKAVAATAAVDQKTVDAAVQQLDAARKAFLKAQQSGKKVTELQTESGHTLAAGTYTVTCNVWFNKADTTLPLNPHITNPVFPPYNPVLGNAVLTVDEDGKCKVTVPVTIQDKIMSVRTLTGLDFTDLVYNDAGGITEFTVDLGVLPDTDTVITLGCHAEIEMGDLAMSISGLDKPHSWPAAFELNLSGVPRAEGGVMPAVEVEMMDAGAASDALANVGGEDLIPEESAAPEPTGSPEPEESQAPEAVEPAADRTGVIIAAAVGIAVVAVIAAVIRKRKQ